MSKEVEEEVRRALAVIAAAGIGTVPQDNSQPLEVPRDVSPRPQAARSVRARSRGIDQVSPAVEAETCFHCHGERTCRCALCAVAGSLMGWVEGECRACLGSGFLAWPRKIN